MSPFRKDQAFLTDTDLWIVVRLRDLNGYCTGTDPDLGQALVRIPLPNTCAWASDGCFADYDNIGVIDGGDVIAYFRSWDAGGVGSPGC